MGMREDVCAPGGILREIGATAAEFERGLRLAVGTALSMPRSGLLRVDDPGTVLEVTLTEMPDRRIGLLAAVMYFGMLWLPLWWLLALQVAVAGQKGRSAVRPRPSPRSQRLRRAASG